MEIFAACHKATLALFLLIPFEVIFFCDLITSEVLARLFTLDFNMR